MLPSEAAMMAADDFAEFAQLARRMEFLKLKSSPAWKYREAEICEAYADVCDARFRKLRQGEPRRSLQQFSHPDAA